MQKWLMKFNLLVSLLDGKIFSIVLFTVNLKFAKTGKLLCFSEFGTSLYDFNNLLHNFIVIFVTQSFKTILSSFC